MAAEIKQEYLTRQETATYMRVSLSTIITLLNLGELKEYRVSADCPRLKLSEIEQYIKRKLSRPK